MRNYQEARVKITNTQLCKLKSSAKNKTGTIIRSIKKNFEEEELPHELFLATRQSVKLRNTFAKNMSIDVKLSKAQISKIIQSDGSFGSSLGNLGKKALTNNANPLARDKLPELANNSNAIIKFARKISGNGAFRAGKGFTVFISNEDMNDIIKIIESLEDSGVLIDGITGKVKYEKKTRTQISWKFVSTFCHFISATSDFIISKWYQWKRS